MSQEESEGKTGVVNNPNYDLNRRNYLRTLLAVDSLTPVSADDFLFSRRKAYPHADDFERSFSFLQSTPCDILVTPHPEASNLWQHLEQRDFRPDALIDPTAWRVLAETSRGQVRKRLATETGR